MLLLHHDDIRRLDEGHRAELARQFGAADGGTSSARRRARSAATADRRHRTRRALLTWFRPGRPETS